MKILSDLIRCDGDLYSPYDDNYFYGDYYYFNPYLFFNPYYYYYGDFDDDYSYGCEGPVCLID